MTQQDHASPTAPSEDEPLPSGIQPELNADHAWKLLSLVNEWIRHADSKATATLAFTGALGALLYNLVKNLADTGLCLDALVVLTCALLGSATILCGLTLAPRTHDQEAHPDEINRIFFGSISKHYQGRRPEYRDVLSTLTSDPQELVRDLADQIHANARIAAQKNTCAKWAIRSVLAAGLGLAVISMLIAN